MLWCTSEPQKPQEVLLSVARQLHSSSFCLTLISYLVIPSFLQLYQKISPVWMTKILIFSFFKNRQKNSCFLQIVTEYIQLKKQRSFSCSESSTESFTVSQTSSITSFKNTGREFALKYKLTRSPELLPIASDMTQHDLCL